MRPPENALQRTLNRLANPLLKMLLALSLDILASLQCALFSGTTTIGHLLTQWMERRSS